MPTFSSKLLKVTYLWIITQEFSLKWIISLLSPPLPDIFPYKHAENSIKSPNYGNSVPKSLRGHVFQSLIKIYHVRIP